MGSILSASRGTVRRMKKVSIRELHAKTGELVREASQHGLILMTDNGVTIAKIVPETNETGVPCFAQRKTSTAFAKFGCKRQNWQGPQRHAVNFRGPGLVLYSIPITQAVQPRTQAEGPPPFRLEVCHVFATAQPEFLDVQRRPKEVSKKVSDVVFSTSKSPRCSINRFFWPSQNRP